MDYRVSFKMVLGQSFIALQTDLEWLAGQPLEGFVKDALYSFVQSGLQVTLGKGDAGSTSGATYPVIIEFKVPTVGADLFAALRARDRKGFIINSQKLNPITDK